MAAPMVTASDFAPAATIACRGRALRGPGRARRPRRQRPARPGRRRRRRARARRSWRARSPTAAYRARRAVRRRRLLRPVRQARADRRTPTRRRSTSSRPGTRSALERARRARRRAHRARGRRRRPTRSTGSTRRWLGRDQLPWLKETRAGDQRARDELDDRPVPAPASGPKLVFPELDADDGVRAALAASSGTCCGSTSPTRAAAWDERIDALQALGGDADRAALRLARAAAARGPS